MKRSDANPRQEGDPNRSFALRLRERRGKMGMTRRQLAAASEISERYLAHLEGGEGNPSLDVLTALARTLNVPLAELLPLGGETAEERARAAAAVRRLRREEIGDLLEWIDARFAQIGGSKAQRISLVGLRGAGKSSLGRALAERLEMPFLEMTTVIEQAFGGKTSLLIELYGPAGFRKYEREAWEDLVKKHGAAVIGVPGGIVANSVTYSRLLMSSHSIWLKATPEEHMSRVMAQGDFRPMGSNPGAMADLKAILDARAGDYARADATYDTSHKSVSEAVDGLTLVAEELLARRQ